MVYQKLKTRHKLTKIKLIKFAEAEKTNKLIEKSH